VVKIFDHLFLLVLTQFIDNSGQPSSEALARLLKGVMEINRPLLYRFLNLLYYIPHIFIADAGTGRKAHSDLEDGL
jgi:hypothetical protein